MKITKDNIEVILFDYAEGNLDSGMQKELECFLESNPQYKQMLAMYLENESVEKPLDIVFGEKDELFTKATGIKAKKALVIPPFAKWAASIAAGVALVLFVGYLFLDNQPQEQIAKSSIQTNNSALSITTSNTESNETKKESAEIKKQSSETKNHFTKTKKEFYYSIEEENATINHQLAFKDFETVMPKTNIENKIINYYYTYERHITKKETPKIITKTKEIINIIRGIGEEKARVVKREIEITTEINV